jgi:Alpha-kinase family
MSPSSESALPCTLGVKRKIQDQFEPKVVRFATQLEQIHELPAVEEFDLKGDDDEMLNTTEEASVLGRTSEMVFLSSLHGRERRELREIDVVDLQSAVKNGVRSRGHPCPKTGQPRWKYVFGNIVYITDVTSTIEVTSYKQAIDISRAPISKDMEEQHCQDLLTLQEDPYLCATHSIVIIDQSASMKKADVKGFRNRSQAAYGVLALEYIAEQVHQRGDQKILDAVSVIEMNDTGTLIYDRQPMDWILFNKLLDRQNLAKPKSHGNYFYSLEAACDLINRELQTADDLDPEDLPSYALIFLSDGKPSDHEMPWPQMQQDVLSGMVDKLKSNFSFHAIGLGHAESDFRALQLLASTVKQHGGTGTYHLSALSGAMLTGAFSSVATSVTATRTAKTSGGDLGAPRETKNVQLRCKSVPQSQRKFDRYLNGVSRWVYDHQKFMSRGNDWPWTNRGCRNADTAGFDMEKSPFGMGAERLAYMFYEINKKHRRLGKATVAKETKYVDNEERKIKFHETFCRVQQRANEFAEKFNRQVWKTPVLRPVDSNQKTPDICFLDCFVYEYAHPDGTKCGVLVENFLQGKFTKYNSNNGYVKKRAQEERKLELACGEVYYSDFVQAFSHWVYVQTGLSEIVCDLQGVLNEEGRHPRFELTDPCINCKKKKSRKLYGKTNLGYNGLRAFRKNHHCNGVCKGLGLPLFGVKHRTAVE